MAWRKEHTVTCTICGTEFKTYSNRAKYCPECAKVQQKLHSKACAEKRKRNRPEKQEIRHIRYSDNREQIKACLSCTAISCNSGQCALNKSLGRRVQTHPRRSEENMRKVLELRAQGMTHKEIGAQLGISETTVLRWAKEMEATHEIQR